METSDIVTVFEPVITAFEQIGISYYIGLQVLLMGYSGQHYM